LIPGVVLRKKDWGDGLFRVARGKIHTGVGSHLGLLLPITCRNQVGFQEE
jgi:hypothetical protein